MANKVFCKHLSNLYLHCHLYQLVSKMALSSSQVYINIHLGLAGHLQTVSHTQCWSLVVPTCHRFDSLTAPREQATVTTSDKVLRRSYGSLHVAFLTLKIMLHLVFSNNKLLFHCAGKFGSLYMYTINSTYKPSHRSLTTLCRVQNGLKTEGFTFILGGLRWGGGLLGD